MFVDLAEFPCFYAVLAWPDHKIFSADQSKTIFWSGHARAAQKQGNSAKSTNNPMLSFGLIE